MRDRDRRVGGLPSEKQIGAGIGVTAQRWDWCDSAIGAQAGWARFGRERKRAEKRRVARGDQLGVARESEKESRQ